MAAKSVDVISHLRARAQAFESNSKGFLVAVCVRAGTKRVGTIYSRKSIQSTPRFPPLCLMRFSHFDENILGTVDLDASKSQFQEVYPRVYQKYTATQMLSPVLFLLLLSLLDCISNQSNDYAFCQEPQLPIQICVLRYLARLSVILREQRNLDQWKLEDKQTETPNECQDSKEIIIRTT